MKKQLILILLFCTVFLLFYGLIFSNLYAANSLKALLDKYKISYNNFTKALKDNANQDKIDQLAEKCKLDYEEYQKASGGLKNNADIPSVPITLPAKESDNALQKTNASNIADKIFQAIKVTPQFKYKYSKIKINGKTENVYVPYPNPDFNKLVNQLPAPPKNKKTLTRISAPLRIGENTKKDIAYPPFPISADVFGFPQDAEDEYRIQGENKIRELFDKVKALNKDNYNTEISNINSLAFSIIANYDYPDLRAIARFYMIESQSMYSSLNNSFQYIYPSSDLNARYAQLADLYNQNVNYNKSMSNLFLGLNTRLAQIRANCENLIKDNQNTDLLIDNAKKDVKDFEKTLNYDNSAGSKDNFLKTLAIKNSDVISLYSRKYLNNVLMSDSQEARIIFHYKYDEVSQKFIPSGKLIEEYNSVPYNVVFKYRNPDPASTEPLTEIIQQFKNAESLLNPLKQLQNANINGLQEDFILNQNTGDSVIYTVNNQIGDTIANFTPSSGSEEKDRAEEKIDSKVLENYKKYAYGYNNQPSNIDFFKRKKTVANLFFAREEYLKIDPNKDIPSPKDSITLRGYESGPYCPNYPVMVTVSNEKEPNRKKNVQLKQNYISGGYLGKFKANDTDDFSTMTNLINNGKDEQKESIAYSRCEVGIPKDMVYTF